MSTRTSAITFILLFLASPALSQKVEIEGNSHAFSQEVHSTDSERVVMSAIASVPSSCPADIPVSVEFFVATGLDMLFDMVKQIAWEGGSTYTHTISRGLTTDQKAYFNSYAVHVPLDVFKEMVAKPFYLNDLRISPSTRSFLAGFSRANPCD